MQWYYATAQVFQHISEKEEATKTTILGITQDLQGFMWFASSAGLYRYDSRQFNGYKHNPDNPKSLSSDYLTSVLCDSRGTLWIGALNGLNQYDVSSDSFKRFRHIPTDKSSIISDTINCIVEDRQKRVWLGTSNGISCITSEKGQIRFTSLLADKSGASPVKVQNIAVGLTNELWLATDHGLIRLENGNVKVFKPKSDQRLGSTEDFESVYADPYGNLWLGVRGGGLMRFTIASQTFQFQEGFRDAKGQWPGVKACLPDGNNKMWIASWSGLVRYDLTTQRAEWNCNDSSDQLSLAENTLMSFFKDRQGGLWLGGYFLGIDYMNPNSPRFFSWRLKIYDTWAGITPQQKIWQITADRSRIFLLNRKDNKMTSYNLDLSFSKIANHFYLDRDEVLWCGGERILHAYDFKSRKRKEYHFPTLEEQPLKKGKIYRIMEDRGEKLWICGSFGLLIFDKKTESFLKQSIQNHILSLFQDSKGNVWCGGKNEVWLFKKDSGQPQRIVLNQKAAESVGVDDVWRITEDARGRIWLAYFSGLRLFHPEKGQFLSYTNGLPGNLSLNDIQSDRNGFLWLCREFDLVRYHPEKGSTQSFASSDGMPRNGAFALNTAFSDSSGRMYFNTSKELFSFYPLNVSSDQRPATIAITGLKLFDEEVDVNHPLGILSNHISREKQLIFKHDQNIFTLDFALLSYKRSERNRYMYKLEGFDKTWNQVSEPSATYMNLPSGNYTFRVKAANGDGFWMEESKELQIIILSPWWKTWYAYLAYLLLAVLFIYLLTRFLWLRATLKKESELYQAKLDFFTNLSHEVRTHLSLIVGPLEKAFSIVPEDGAVKPYLKFARNNSGKLMQLINELLDFRKIQNGNTQLQVREYDLVKVLKNILSSFEHLSVEKKIPVQFTYSDPQVIVWVDLLQLQKVFFNLLSNAFKFTDPGGLIKVDLVELSNEVIVKVTDTGRGIPSADIPNLFENFFQSNVQDSSQAGYGIGLALSKAIVNAHQAELAVSSRLPGGNQSGETIFSLRILRGNKHFSEDQFGKTAIFSNSTFAVLGEENNESGPAVDLEKKHTLLLIEDNDELRAFEVEIFSNFYRVLEAANGKDGLEMAYKHIPDLILCDVMMPEINGIEVCKELKTDSRTAHIPVILLTARGAVSQVIEGLSACADDYLVKPFDNDVLLLKVGNLIRERELQRRDSQKTEISEQAESLVPNFDGEFLDKLQGVVMQNLADADFGVNEMAFQVGMSVSVLYRKLRSLTGMTVNDFIKTVRMKKAFQLIESGRYHVNEVATMVGYEDTRYFSKEFKKIYGKNPSEVRSQAVE